MRKPLALVAVALLAVPSLAAGDDPAPVPAPVGPDAAALEGAFLPKAETRVTDLLSSRPEADGRGVVVAILDTGVDPGHPRLSKTSTGETKLVDFLDATDDGLVETSIAVDGEDGKLVGATGRLLTLGAHRKAGEPAFLGRIDAVAVLPSELVSRLKAKRHERHDAAVRRAKEGGGFPFQARPGEGEKLAEARKHAEAKALETLADETPAFDVAVFVGAGGPRVVIDTDADGDLAEEKALLDFSKAQEWTTLRDDCELNVAVRPDADGKRIRLLFDGEGHGTHVAGIVAGYEGPKSPLNGVAPGARILAIKVGNSRYGGPTTNLAILRALDWAGRRGAKVANLSFGGPSFTGDAGTPDARAADDAVERYGLLCCFSAGNEGPALTTVGSPASARRVLSVGAYVSPPTMKVSYAQLGDDPGERLFGFSSRGPLPGGDLGISVVAPGAAWSPLPSWTLSRAENWNGTSMAAPQVAGACALLLSGAAREKVAAPPARVIRAIKATARPVEGLYPFEQGAGLLQADKALALLLAMRDAPEERELRAVVEGPLGRGGGVYERGLAGKEPFDRTVRIETVWPDAATNEARAAFEKRLVLSSDRPWVQVPPRVGVNARGGSFALRIDPSSLSEGVHSGTVTATDPARPRDGPELSVPVTIVVPAAPDASGRRRGTLTIAPGERASRFVRVPEGAGRAVLRLVEREGGRNGWTACLSSVDPWRRQDDRLAEKRMTLDAGDSGDLSVSVRPGTVLEATLFSSWNANRKATLDLEISFEGPVCADSRLDAGPGEDVVTLRIASPFAPFRGTVVAKVEGLAERPAVEKEVAAIPETLLGGDRLFVSTQRFRVRVKAEETVNIVPLGDSSLDEQREDARWRVIDGAGRVVKKAVIDGPFDLKGIPPGDYRVEYETPTWGKAAAEAGLTGFEVRREFPCKDCKVHPTADLAAEGTGADAKVDMPAGGRRSLAIRLPALDAGKAYRGTVEVKDEADRVRLSIPLFVDRRTDGASDPAAAEKAFVASLRAAASDYADDPFADPRGLTDARERARRAASMDADDVDLEFLSLRLDVAPAHAEDSRGKGDAALLDRVEKSLAKRDKTEEDDRPRIGRLLLLRSVLRDRAGKEAEAKADLVEARFLLPDKDPDVLAVRVARGSVAGGDLQDALEAAKALVEAHPTSLGGAVELVNLYRKLAWGLPAAVELRGWPERFPAAVAEFRGHAALVRAVGGDPAPRTLSAIGPP